MTFTELGVDHNKMRRTSPHTPVYYTTMGKVAKIGAKRGPNVGQTWADLNERALVGWDLLGRESAFCPHAYLELVYNISVAGW